MDSSPNTDLLATLREGFRRSVANRLVLPRRHLASFIPAIVIGGVMIILAGCATSPPPAPPPVPIPAVQPIHPPAPPPPVRTVTASWYGPGFEGHTTTSGERFDSHAMTAASKTLPLGSTIKVRNPANGRSVNVRINDRGPFVRGRSLDLSHAAAQKLGMTHKGVTRVEITRIKTPAEETADAE